MDPLSITTTAIGLAGTVFTAALAVKSEIENYRAAPQTLSDIADEVQTVRAALRQVESALENDPDVIRRFQLEDDFSVSVKGCHTTLLCISEEYSRLFGRKDWRARIMVLWKEGDMIRLLGMLDRKKQSITLLLHALSLRTINDTRALILQQQSTIEAAKQDLCDLIPSYPSLQAPILESLDQETAASILGDRESRLSTTEFAFDYELINTKTYRRALARLQATDKLNMRSRAGLSPELEDSDGTDAGSIDIPTKVSLNPATHVPHYDPVSWDFSRTNAFANYSKAQTVRRLKLEEEEETSKNGGQDAQRQRPRERKQRQLHVPVIPSEAKMHSIMPPTLQQPSPEGSVSLSSNIAVTSMSPVIEGFSDSDPESDFNSHWQGWNPVSASVSSSRGSSRSRLPHPARKGKEVIENENDVDPSSAEDNFRRVVGPVPMTPRDRKRSERRLPRSARKGKEVVKNENKADPGIDEDTYVDWRYVDAGSRTRDRRKQSSSLIGITGLPPTSSTSINDPKLLEIMEDVIRRLILPDLESVKRKREKRGNTVVSRMDRPPQAPYYVDVARLTEDLL
ncbi:hypothetical protein GGR54DRAFT_494028 [Hypoxylon sp. NC1633]|nr:hypothetical protein GGR54DRAFT_494028 [Hypoxylon sp. NC1633]